IFHYFIFGLLFLCIQCVPWFLKPVMAFALEALVALTTTHVNRYYINYDYPLHERRRYRFNSRIDYSV
ncbi:MAG: hypothetical protein JXB88_09210, partial [Spirochaetales bacterium]|nr:hypothetical protein [Spirochaetales bacterium]